MKPLCPRPQLPYDAGPAPVYRRGISSLSVTFAAGQRWVSNTEAELGLGLVIEHDSRRVTLVFPAAEEQRTYAVDNAPLSRVEYSPGERVKTDEGLSLVLTERHDQDAFITYAGVDDAGQEHELPESRLTGAVQFSKPEDRLFAGQIDAASAFNLRIDTLGYQQRHRSSPVYGLLGPRVQLLAHQMHIAHRVGAQPEPRVLLADEVGLGKTIEAGLVLHQQLLCGAISRVLVVVPDALVNQWFVELLRRFNLSFSVFDEQRCAETQAEGHGNPFESAQLLLCPLSLLTTDELRHTQCLQACFDMLVVDEAHHLAWSETHASLSYQRIEQLARGIRGLLLLTATPEQLGLDGHFARLRLVDPDRYFDRSKFLEEERGFHELARLLNALDGPSQEPAALRALALQALPDDLSDAESAEIAAHIDAGDNDALIEKLIDRYGTGRVLFRNTRQSIGGFGSRRLFRHPLPPDEDTGWLEQRFAWLVDWLDSHRGEKCLLITHSAETVKQLEVRLRLAHGFRTAAFHEHMALLARDRAAAYFAELDGGADILLCSEIGSEGRNFQFAHQLILFDLPDHPDLLEQRIGRLDRIGQRHTVDIHVPYVVDSAEQLWLEFYDQAMDAFSMPGEGGERIMTEVAECLTEALATPADAVKREQLIALGRAQSGQIREALSRGRNRLLELNSCHPRHAAEVLDALNASAHPLELSGYMERVFDRFGVEQRPHEAHSVIIHPTEQMLFANFPGLPEDGLTATYNRWTALGREDISFLTWEHPMVTGVMDLIAHGEFGNTAVSAAEIPGIRAGTVLLESFFVFSTVAPWSARVERFTPKALLRTLVDNHGSDFTTALPREQLEHRVERVPRRTAEEIVRQARGQIRELVEHSNQLARQKRLDLVESALAQLHTLREPERARLSALCAVNPNMDDRELAGFDAESTELEAYLGNADLRLDAIRVLLVT